MKGIVLFAHGARDPAWAEPFRRLQEIVAAQQKTETVALAFLEFMPPTLAEAVAAMLTVNVRDICIVPLFLGPGAHFRHDFPLLLDALRRQYPQVVFRSTSVVGDSEAILHAIADWIARSI
ncbi:MAG TPA: CbiX/SirB N-terminal domain-containing protein [Burkholderiales bacterium]|nr:CbiX/SirB N-terminal domain-containing protein [Burkholderiales bacterium]